MNPKLTWYSGRCLSWLSAIVAAGNLSDPIKDSITADLKDQPVDAGGHVNRLAVMVSWLESLSGVLPPEDKARIKRLLLDIEESQKELLE